VFKYVLCILKYSAQTTFVSRDNEANDTDEPSLFRLVRCTFCTIVGFSRSTTHHGFVAIPEWAQLSISSRFFRLPSFALFAVCVPCPSVNVLTCHEGLFSATFSKIPPGAAQNKIITKTAKRNWHIHLDNNSGSLNHPYRRPTKATDKSLAILETKNEVYPLVKSYISNIFTQVNNLASQQHPSIQDLTGTTLLMYKIAVCTLVNVGIAHQNAANIKKVI